MKPARLLLVCLAFTFLAPAAPAQSDDSGAALGALTQVLAGSDDAQFQFDILKGMSDGLKGRRGVKMPEGWDALAEKLMKSQNAQVRDLAQALSVQFGSAKALAALRAVLVDAKADAGQRKGALATLLQARDPQLPGVLQGLIKDSGVSADALRGLAAFDDPKTPAAIIEAYPGLGTGEKRDAVTTLASRVAYAKALMTAIGEQKIAARELTAETVRQLQSLKDAQLNEQVVKFWGVTRETAADKLKEIERFKKLVAAKGYGDTRRGRAVYARVCQQCHTLFGEGGKVGPDITGSNRPDLEYVLQNAIDPNAVIPNDYRTWNVETKDDRSITGIVTRQDDNAVTVVTANETIVLPRGDVKSMSQSELSMMPEGLLQALTEDEVRDLLAYLKSPSQVPLPVENK
jgi:putative heme-binding domain-containing protein